MKARTTRPMTKPHRAYAYTRVSTTEQAERDNSLPAQLKAIRDYAARQGIEIVREFEEPGASGTDDSRPVFKEMIAKAFANDDKIDEIIVYQTSRFMRDVSKSRYYKGELSRRGIRVVSTQQDVGDDPMGRMIEVFFESIDQYESEVNGLRTRAAMQENARRGYFNGSHAPFGFKVTKVDGRNEVKKGKLIPNPDEIPALTTAFQLYIAGSGAKGVARELNQRGLLYRGRVWSKHDVLRVIEEEAAVGVYYWGRRNLRMGEWYDRAEWIAIPVEPIVDRALFDMAQQIRKSRDPEKNPGRTASSPLLLAGLVRCGKCGAAYQLETAGTVNDNGDYLYRYYNCRNAVRVGREVCAGFRIPVATLERAVSLHIADQLFTPERCQTMLRQVAEESDTRRRRAELQRAQLRTELEAAERGIARWNAAFESGADIEVLGADRLRELKTRAQSLRESLDKVRVPTTPPAWLYTPATLAAFQSRLRERLLTGDMFARNYLRFFVAGITVTDAQVELEVKANEAITLLAAGAENEKTAGGVNTPPLLHTTVVDWLRL